MLMRVDSCDEGLFGVKDEVAETELSLVLINLERNVFKLGLKFSTCDNIVTVQQAL